MARKHETPEQTASRRERERESARRYRERNPAYMKQWRASDAGKSSMKNSGLRASTEGTFDLQLWQALVALQGGACAICRRPFEKLGFRDVHADHCHDELKPRGLLCRNCNHAEGQIRKTGLSPEEFCRRMGAYLSAPPARSVSNGRQEPARKDSNAVG